MGNRMERRTYDSTFPISGRYRLSNRRIFKSLGRLVQGSDGYWYPLGFKSKVKLSLDSSGWMAVTEDGTRQYFEEQYDTALGTFAWYLSRIETTTGAQTQLTWITNASGRRFLREITYGGASRTDAQRILIHYEHIDYPFPFFTSGEEQILDQRVHRVEAFTRHLTSGVYTLRWQYDFIYTSTYLSAAYYLESVTRTFVSDNGEQTCSHDNLFRCSVEPSVIYTYDTGLDRLEEAEFTHIPELDAYIGAGGGASLYPTQIANFDLEKDGLVELEHYYAFAQVQRGESEWTFTPLPENPSANVICRPAPSAYNKPRLHARMFPQASEPHVVITVVTGIGTTHIGICNRIGDLLFEQEIAGIWSTNSLVKLTDLNKDKRPDFIRVFPGGYQVLENQSTPDTFVFSPRIAGTLSPEVAMEKAWIQDINGDGLVDIVSQISDGIRVWYGRGNFNFESQAQNIIFYNNNGLIFHNISSYEHNFFDANKDGLMDVLLISRAASHLLINHGGYFRYLYVPALTATARVDVSIPVTMDLRATGEVEVVVTTNQQAHALQLTYPSSGLLIRADDGRGNQWDFEYQRSPRANGIPQRTTTIAHMQSHTGGKDSLRLSYGFESPVARQDSENLIGFETVRRTGPLSVETANFLIQENLPPAVRYLEATDLYTPNLIKYTQTDFENRIHLGIPWLRPTGTHTGWRSLSDDTTLEEYKRITRYTKEWCPTEFITRSLLNGETLHGTATHTINVANNITRLDSELHCLPQRLQITGEHNNSDLDFTEIQRIYRNELGQVTQVERLTAQADENLECSTLQAGSRQDCLVTQTIEYDELHRVSTVTKPGQGTVTAVYDDAGILRQTINPDGVIKSILDIDPVTNSILQINTVRGGETYSQNFRFDGFERLQNNWDNFGGSSANNPLTQLTYDFPTASNPGVIETTELITTSTDSTSSSEMRSVELFYADGSEFAMGTLIPEGWSFGAISRHNRNLAQIQTHLRSPLTTFPSTQTYESFFPLASAPIDQVENAGFGHIRGSLTTYDSDSQGQLTTEVSLENNIGLRHISTENGANTVVVESDAANRPLAKIDQDQNRTTFNYDALGRITTIILPSGITHNIDYDDFGRVAFIQRGGIGEIIYTYNNNDLLEQKQFRGTNLQIDRTTTYIYDEIGRVIEEQHHKHGQGTPLVYTFSYDGTLENQPGQLGYLSSIRSDGYEKTVVYNPDETIRSISVILDNWRRVTIDNEYYENGSKRASTRTIYDINNNIILEQTHKGFFYDAYGRLEYVELNQERIFTIYYDTLGRVEYVQFGQNQELRPKYDEVTRSKSGDTLNNNIITSSLDWDINNRGFINEEMTVVGQTSQRRAYAYSARGFLEGVSFNDYQESYTYDIDGIPTTAQDRLGSRSLVKVQQSISTATITYNYDLLGRVIRKGDISFVYGPHGYLSSATVESSNKHITYLYDESGERILKRSDGIIEAAYLFGGYLDNDRFVEPMRIDGRLVAVINGGLFQLLHTDLRGTLIADENGIHNEVSPYGVRESRTDFFKAVDFVEKGYDEDLGTIRFGIRDYDPYLAQFTTPDTYLFEEYDRCAKDLVGCNLISYANNNPINLVDPEGKFAFSATAVLTALSYTLGIGLAAYQVHSSLTTQASQGQDPFSNEEINTRAGIAGGIGALTTLIGSLAAKIANPYLGFVVAVGGGIGAGTATRALANEEISATSVIVDGTVAGGAFGLGRLGQFLGNRGTQEAAKKAAGGVCFVAGTLVSTPTGTIVIEQIQVGDRVITHQLGRTGSRQFKDWYKVSLVLGDDDSVVEIDTLRDSYWLAENKIRKGGTLYLNLDELGVAGLAKIEEVEILPDLPDGNGRLVLTKFNTLSNDVYEVTFVGGEKLRPTGRHPLYSLDRNDWVRVQDLQIGERLQTAEGAVAVEALEKVRGLHRVYNFEVEGDHEYLVGEAGVRSHNSSALNCGQNAKILGENLAAAGRPVGPGQAAGHIVASTGSKGRWAAAARSRDILSRFGVDINDAANGIPIGHPNPHGITHTKFFHEMVETRLTAVVNRLPGANKNAVADALRTELMAIGEDVLRAIK